MNCHKRSAYCMRLILFLFIILLAVGPKPWKLYHDWRLRLRFPFGNNSSSSTIPPTHTCLQLVVTLCLTLSWSDAVNVVTFIHRNIIHLRAIWYLSVTGPSIARWRSWNRSVAVVSLLTYSLVQSPSWEANWLQLVKKFCCSKLLYINQGEREIKYSFKDSPSRLDIQGFKVPSCHLLAVDGYKHYSLSRRTSLEWPWPPGTPHIPSSII